jgi:2-polyprenyl-3-methyl-5-hydroxy-6-metoxy-1,4-benzoquinol methylase
MDVIQYSEKDVRYEYGEQEEQALPGFQKYRLNGWYQYMLGRYLYVLKYVKNKRVLDAGCGFGWGTYLLSGSSSELIGVDIDEGAICFAKETWRDTNAKFLTHSVLRLEELKKEFDVVVSFEVLEHFSLTEGKQYLWSMGKCLSDNGILVMSSFFPEKDEAAQKAQVANPYHLHIYTKKEMEEFMQMAGMKVMKWFGEFMLIAKKVPKI